MITVGAGTDSPVANGTPCWVPRWPTPTRPARRCRDLFVMCCGAGLGAGSAPELQRDGGRDVQRGDRDDHPASRVASGFRPQGPQPARGCGLGAGVSQPTNMRSAADTAGGRASSFPGRPRRPSLHPPPQLKPVLDYTLNVTARRSQIPGGLRGSNLPGLDRRPCRRGLGVHPGRARHRGAGATAGAPPTFEPQAACLPAERCPARTTSGATVLGAGGSPWSWRAVGGPGQLELLGPGRHTGRGAELDSRWAG